MVEEDKQDIKFENQEGYSQDDHEYQKADSAVLQTSVLFPVAVVFAGDLIFPTRESTQSRGACAPLRYMTVVAIVYLLIHFGPRYIRLVHWGQGCKKNLFF